MQNIINLFKSNLKPSEQQGPELAKQLQILEGRLRGAIRFLKKTSIRKNGKNVALNHLPWFLIIGTTGSGKTALLANSDINFILDKHVRREHIAEISSETCDWWATRDAVLVDVPGNYITAVGKNSQPNSLWHHFLESIQALRGQNGLRGIIITLSLQELLDRKSRHRFVANVKQRIAQLRNKFGNDLPFYFTITKCDLLPGFQDFFHDCSSDELAQAWGMSLPSGSEPLIEICVNRFDALIGRLNKQLIWRLHQERNAYSRIYIKEFPLQIERVKEGFVEVLKALTKTEGKFALKGVYLTSARQEANEDQATAYPQTVSADDFQRSMEIMNAPIVRRRAYFTKQFLLQCILQGLPAPVEKKWQQRFMIAALAICLVVIIVGSHGTDFLSNLRNISDVRHDIAQNELNTRQKVSQQIHSADSAQHVTKVVSQQTNKFSKSTREDNV